MKEIWKWIPSFEEHYQVSNIGNVRSVKRMTAGRWDNLKTSNGRQLKLEISNCGYLRACLSMNGKTKKHSVHRLVALAFLDKSDKNCVNHIDGNRKNNNINNLEWCTYKENTNTAMGLNRLRWRFGERHPCSKLNDEKVKSILKEYIPWKVGCFRLATKYGVTARTIQSIILGLTWKHIPRQEQRRKLDLIKGELK